MRVSSASPWPRRPVRRKQHIRAYAMIYPTVPRQNYGLPVLRGVHGHETSAFNYKCEADTVEAPKKVKSQSFDTIRGGTAKLSTALFSCPGLRLRRCLRCRPVSFLVALPCCAGTTTLGSGAPLSPVSGSGTLGTRP